MTDKDKNNRMNEFDENLDSLFKKASEEIWNPHEGFDSRVLARIASESKQPIELGTLAWKAVPFAVAASIIIGVLAYTGDSIQTIVYSEIMDPLAVENIMTLLAG